MGCCMSTGDADPTPMSGGQTVGRVGGAAISRDEAREKAAAAAEARARQQQTRGQQGGVSKIKHTAGSSQGYDGKPDVRDPRVWD